MKEVASNEWAWERRLSSHFSKALKVFHTLFKIGMELYYIVFRPELKDYAAQNLGFRPCVSSIHPKDIPCSAKKVVAYLLVFSPNSSFILREDVCLGLLM
jgi:hypothetical protein